MEIAPLISSTIISSVRQLIMAAPEGEIIIERIWMSNMHFLDELIVHGIDDFGWGSFKGVPTDVTSFFLTSTADLSVPLQISCCV